MGSKRIKPRIEVVPELEGGQITYKVVLVNHDETRLEMNDENFREAKTAIEAANQMKEFLKWPISYSSL